jgi:chromosome segregation ATPase
MGYLKFAKLIGGAALVGGLIWLGATINGWRLDAKAQRAANVVLTEKVTEKDRQLRGCDTTIKELRAVNTIKDGVIAESRGRGEELARRLQGVRDDNAILERERAYWRAQPYPEDCEATMRELALRGGARK